MPPQTQTPPPTQQPASSDYGFIMNQQNKPKKFNFSLAGVPKPAKIALGVVSSLFVLIMLASLLGGNKSNPPLVNLIAQQQELIRVTGMAAKEAPDINSRALASTTYTTVLSSQTFLSSLLKKADKTLLAKTHNSYLDKRIDSQLKAAIANSQFGQVLGDYLKSHLSAYQTALQKLQGGSSRTVRPILIDAINSNQTLLKAIQN